VALARRQVRTALNCSKRVPYRVFQSRDFALAVEVGRGRNAKTEPLASYERSPEQERAALAEYERMVRATQRLLKLETLTPGSVQELRVVFHYWTGTRSRAVVAAKHANQNALEQAESLLEWMLASQIDSDFLFTVFRSNECVTGAVVNMIEQYLMPFRGTHQSLKIAGCERRHRSHHNVVELKSALQKATKLMDLLQNLFDDPLHPKLVADEIASNMMLNLWVKRCWFLAEHGGSVDDHFVRTVLKGVSSVEDCLEAMKECMESLSSPDPSSTVSLYLSAWVNSGLPNRAQEAHAILRKAKDDPSLTLSNVAYNTVLYAYASSVEHDRANATRAVDLLNHMWSEGIECDVSAYSSLLLAHAKAGDPEKAVELLMQMEEEANKTKVFPNTICYNTGELAGAGGCIRRYCRLYSHNLCSALKLLSS